MNNSSRCARGQIWYADPGNNTVEGHNAIMTKCRPYLIVSSNQGNFSSPDIIGLPLTSSNTDSPRSVDMVVLIDDKLSRICCSKPTPISQDQLRSYKCTVSDWLMEEVESHMIVALGMTDRWVLRDKQIAEFGALIGEYKKIQNLISAMKQNNIDSYADISSEFIRNLDMPILRDEPVIKKIDDPPKKKRMKWDEETCISFIDDYESGNNSKDALSEYYGVTNVSQAYYHAKRALKKILDDKEKEDV